MDYIMSMRCMLDRPAWVAMHGVIIGMKKISLLNSRTEIQ